VSSTFLYGANVRANGIRQHYLRYGGKGPALLIVPGITSPAITWDFVGQRLGEQFDVYIIDVRGRGLSEAGDHLDYGINALGADAAAFAKAVGLTDYGMIGHSMGGRIVPRAVARYGATPSKIMLVDPPMNGPGRRGFPQTDAWFTDQIEAGARGDMTIDQMRQYFPRWSDEHLLLRTEWIHTCDPRAIIQIRKDFLEDDFHAELPSIQQPMLVIAAGQADLILPEEQAELESLNPNIKTIRLDHVGHMVPWDDLDGFVKLVVEFFKPAA
jgi:N-formylmaleamate deformylase